jgi:ketosteroid isomerase-like protein
MLTLRKICLLALTASAVGSLTRQVLGQTNEKSAIESTVRTYEHACETYDFQKANSMLAPDAQWIEASYPAPAEFTGQGWNNHWEEYKSAQLHIDYHLRDFTTKIHGDVAWVTRALDGIFTADTPAALALNENQKEWRGTYVESYVLIKINGAWKIALGHTSLLPKK